MTRRVIRWVGSVISEESASAKCQHGPQSVYRLYQLLRRTCYREVSYARSWPVVMPLGENWRQCETLVDSASCNVLTLRKFHGHVRQWNMVAACFLRHSGAICLTYNPTDGKMHVVTVT